MIDRFSTCPRLKVTRILRNTYLNAALIAGGALLPLCAATPKDGPRVGAANERLFAVTVYPLLVEKCFACHGRDPDKLKGGLDLTTRRAMLRGGESSENVLVPKNARVSLLYRAVAGRDPDLQMPPKENDRLTPVQVEAVRKWINGGAAWPARQRRETLQREARRASGLSRDQVAVPTSGGLSPEWTTRRYERKNLWAYRPVKSTRVPARDSDHHPIDAFVDRNLARLGLNAAPRADRRTLLRRATYDLLGLPPTPDEVEAFLNDSSSDREAFATVVERLLRSPHYGEQWGRHWLDVVRYADTAGFSNDFERPNAWRYRDYVIRSFNTDKPYDQFVREQLAGDELDPANPEMLIAVGFLRMGPWEQTGMSVAKITRQQFLDDVTDSVGQVFLSHPLQCCRCHDHKFDPIPTRDYYRIQAVFATTQFAERDAAFLPAENQAGFERERQYLQERIQRYEADLRRIRAKNERAARKWYADRGLKYAPRRELQRRGVAEDRIAPRHIGLTTQDFGLERVARKNLTRHRWELDRFRPLAFSVYSGGTPYHRSVSSRLRMPGNPEKSGQIEKTAILAGGNPFTRAAAVKPGVLSCVAGLKEAGVREAGGADTSADRSAVTSAVSGRRLAFAKWVTDPKNPLTARSIVNRVWQYHFGRGLARNPNNFGAMGGKPTHPELLDWLAARFVSEGWSIKKLHRLIMSSDAYCRSSVHPDMKALTPRDPERTSLACFRRRRLSAEELRDSMLAVSGELRRSLGGLPVRPEMNLEVALQPRQIMGTYAPAYQPSPLPADRHRRSIYAVRIRGQRDPFLEVFNQPASERSCERRESSTVTPQVFSLFNGQQSYDRALAMAARIARETRTDAEAVTRAFQLVYQRPPTADELADCLTHWREMTAAHETRSYDRPELPREIVRHAVEEMNGEPFTFTERLDMYEDFVPDLKPWDVEPRVRGLGELCLVLLNSSEFVYVQ